MFSKAEEEVVIFSPMQGQITLNGKPVSNARIERYLKWKDEEGERDYFETDGDGWFEIPVKQDVVKLSTISQFVIAQEIRVYVDNNEYLIWTLAKSSKVKFGELGGRAINFRCELTDEPTRVEVNDGLLGTSCKWDSIDKQGD